MEGLDRAGVSAAMTSISAPGFSGLSPGETIKAVRAANEFARRMIADHPSRFGMFAAVPLPHIDAALEEVRYAADQLHAEGVGLMTNYDGRYLGDRLFDPFFAELQARQTVVFVHPATCNCTRGIDTGVPLSSIEFPHETTRTIVSLLSGGVFTRCPDVRFIFSHAGGSFPYLETRVARLNAPLRESLPALQRQFFDTALSAYQQVFSTLTQFVPPSQILFGSDFPFAGVDTINTTANELSNLQLPAGALAAIGRDNALRLFPALANRLAN